MDKFLEKFAEWLFGQGVSTVLLFAFIWVMWRNLPELSKALNGLQAVIDKTVLELETHQEDTKERFTRLDVDTKDNFKTLIAAVNSLLKEIAVLLVKLDSWDNEAKASRGKAKEAYNEIKGMVDDMPKKIDDNISTRFGELQKQLEDKIK